MQTQNSKLNHIIERLKGEQNNKLRKYYQLINNKLYRKCKNSWKLYIPTELRSELINEIHAVYGHLGSKRLFQTLKEHFTMDSMFKSIKNIT